LILDFLELNIKIIKAFILMYKGFIFYKNLFNIKKENYGKDNSNTERRPPQSDGYK
jgi:hypothetical protein